MVGLTETGDGMEILNGESSVKPFIRGGPETRTLRSSEGSFSRL